MNIQKWIIRLLPYGRELERRAYYDPLTQALTRGRTVEVVTAWLQSSANIMLVYVDLDGLKAANDTRGHRWGDMQLRLFIKNADYLAEKYVQKSKRHHVALGRMGGDEFLFTFRNISRTCVENLLAELQTHMPNGIGFSFGIVEAHRDKSKNDFDALLQKADKLMYKQKGARGKKRRIRKQRTSNT